MNDYAQSKIKVKHNYHDNKNANEQIKVIEKLEITCNDKIRN